MFPELVPTLIKKPITAFNARALSSLASVAGTALNKRLSSILDSLASTLEAGASDDIIEAVNEAIHSIMGAVADSEGLHILVTQLLEWYVLLLWPQYIRSGTRVGPIIHP